MNMILMYIKCDGDYYIFSAFCFVDPVMEEFGKFHQDLFKTFTMQYNALMNNKLLKYWKPSLI